MGVFFVGLLLIVGDVGFGCFDGCFFSLLFVLSCFCSFMIGFVSD